MSRAFLESFFPQLLGTTSDNNYYCYHLYDHLLLPKDVMDTCTEIIMTIHILQSSTGSIGTPTSATDVQQQQQLILIRNPALCLFAVIGAIFGIYISLFDTTLGLLLQNISPKLRQVQQYTASLDYIHYWSISFLFFGLMNIAAIPLHCLLSVANDREDATSSVSSSSSSYDRIVPLPQQYPYLWIMDTICTGVFALSMIVALLCCTTTGSSSAMRTTSNGNKKKKQYTYLILILLFGCIAIGRFLMYGSSLELELWYTLPLLCAALLFIIHFRTMMKPVFTVSIDKCKPPFIHFWYIVALLWLVSGIVTDQISCRLQNQYQPNATHSTNLSWWWDFTRLPAIAFGACDLYFIALYYHIRMLFTAAKSTTTSSLSSNEYKEAKKYA